MYRNIIWAICNLIIMFLSSIYNGSSFLFIVPIISMPLLYDGFSDSIRDLKNKRITKKELYHEYCKYQAFTPIKIVIYLKVFFAPVLIINALQKITFSSLYQSNTLILIGGILIIISLFIDILVIRK